MAQPFAHGGDIEKVAFTQIIAKGVKTWVLVVNWWIPTFVQVLSNVLTLSYLGPVYVQSET